MKLNKYIWLAAMPMLFSACQNDTLGDGFLQKDGIYSLSGKMSGGAAMSRAQVVLGNTDGSKESFMWNEEDAFALYQGDNNSMTQHVFTISADYSESGTGDKKSATFTTDNPAQAMKYTAVYPAGTRIENNSVKMELQPELDFSWTSTEADRNEIWSEYMRNYMYMMAEGTLVSGGVNVLSFRHLCALARVTYTNATGETQKIMKLNFGGDQNFTTSTSYNVSGGYQDGSSSTNSYTLNLNGLNVDPGQSVDMYAFFFPHDFSLEGEMHLNVNTNSGDKGVRLATTKISEANGGAKGFEAGKRYWFKVTESSEGLVWSKDFTMETVTINNKSLSLALQSALGDDVVSLDEDSCAVIGELIVKSLKVLDFSNYEDKKNLTSLEGIEIFESLEVLNCNNTGLTSLKLTNPALSKVSVEDTPLTSLDVSGLSNLIYLSCAFCGDLGDNINVDGTNLEEIRFQHTNATVLPTGLVVSKLIILDSGDNKLTNLNLSECTILKELYLARNDLSNETLLLPQNNNLRILDISGNEKITEFDLTQSPKLTDLWASGDAIETLDFSKCPDIEFISCADNKLTELDLTANEKINYLDCGNQKEDRTLTLKLPASLVEKWNNEWASNNYNVKLETSGDTPAEGTITIKNTELATALQAVLGTDKVSIDSDGFAVMTEADVLAVTSLDFGWGDYTITSLSGIEYFTNLHTLSCNKSNLVSCDFSQNVNLEQLLLWGNGIQTLDLSNNPKLTKLDVGGNLNLSSLNINNCTNLLYLHVSDTNLSELAIPNKSILKTLGYGYTELSFNVNEFTSLTELRCYGHNFDALNLSSTMKAQLEHLQCYYCEIVELDLSEYPNLNFLSCYGNNLTTLDLSKSPNLEYLNCHTNNIENLDITPLENLYSIHVGIQKNEIIMSLTMTEVQKDLWDSNWINESLNERVNVIIGVSSSNNISGSDFTIEGIY